jgi:hypothetical protein
MNALAFDPWSVMHRDPPQDQVAIPATPLFAPATEETNIGAIAGIAGIAASSPLTGEIEPAADGFAATSLPADQAGCDHAREPSPYPGDAVPGSVETGSHAYGAGLPPPTLGARLAAELAAREALVTRLAAAMAVPTPWQRMTDPLPGMAYLRGEARRRMSLLPDNAARLALVVAAEADAVRIQNKGSE